jgi:hypothetical protein
VGVTEDMGHLGNQGYERITLRKYTARKILHACVPISAEKIAKILHDWS